MSFRKSILALACLSLVSVPAKPSHADSDSMKAIMGGMLGSIIVEGVKEMSKPQEQPEEPIQWHDQQPAEQQVDPALQERRARNREIQGALTKIGFYNDAVDGIAGPGTIAAIKAWETEFGQVIDGQLTESELEYLRTVSDGGFTNKADYDAAKEAGYSDYAEYAEFKRSGFSSKVDLMHAQKAGFKTKQEYDRAIAAGYATQSAFDESKIESVKHLLNDLEDFLPSYEGDIDISLITTTLKKLEPVKQGKWQDEFDRPANELQEYASGLSGFPEFQRQKQEERRMASEQRKADMLAEIRDIHTFSEKHLRKNLTDSHAVNLAEDMKNEPVVTSAMQEKDIAGLLASARSRLNENNLSRQYAAWKRGDSPPSEAAANPAAGAQPVSYSGNQPDGTPRIGNPLDTKKYRIVIESVDIRHSVGDGMFFNSQPAAGAVYVVVDYSVTNIGNKPASSWSSPSFYLRDGNDTRYSADMGASAAYAAETGNSEKIVSNLNPGITMKGAEVFEVSQNLFDKTSWAIEVDADKDFRVSLH